MWMSLGYTTGMHGHLWLAGGTARSLVAAAVATLVSTGCARNVAQHANSGKDYRYKGARTIELEDGEGRAKDIVTYPGGDRVDWKVVTLPEGKKGRLELRFRLKTPRPGLDAALNVYDEWFHEVGRAKPSTKGKKSTKSKKVAVEDASGKYYIQIYAPRRTDAAAYTLRLEFREKKAPVIATNAVTDISDPPSLPGVPEPKPVDPAQAAMAGQVPPPTQPETTGSEPPAAAAQPVKAMITKVVSSTGGVILTVNRGKIHGVASGWRGTVLKGSSDSALDGGDFKIIKVSERESVAKVKLSVDQFQNNRYVFLTPQ